MLLPLQFHPSLTETSMRTKIDISQYLEPEKMGDISSFLGPGLAPKNKRKSREDTEAYKATTLDFLNKAWGDKQWMPPTTIPRRNGNGTPLPPDQSWTVGELDVLKEITISALSRDIVPLSALYMPGGAIFEAAFQSERPRWCIKVCANARRVVRESAEPHLTKKQVFEMVMAGALDGRVRVRGPVASGTIEHSCPEHKGCLCRRPSLKLNQPVSDFGLSTRSRRMSDPEPRLLASFWAFYDQKREVLAQ